MIQREHDPIELEVFRLELIPFEQIELHLSEGQLLGVQHKADALTARRLRGVVERECHLELQFPALPLEQRSRDMSILHNLHEIYVHFTCDRRAMRFEWLGAQPPFSSLQA